MATPAEILKLASELVDKQSRLGATPYDIVLNDGRVLNGIVSGVNLSHTTGLPADHGIILYINGKYFEVSADKVISIDGKP